MTILGAKSKPFVTVVMPVRNEETWLSHALDSVLAQTYPPNCIEVILAVGPSTDQTRTIANSYASRDGRILVLENHSGRTSDALNVAIQAARGALIARVDGHGWIAPDYLEEAREALEATGADAVGGVVSFVGHGRIGEAIAIAEGSRLGGGTAAFRSATALTDADGLRWGVFTRGIIERVGPYDEQLVRNQDDDYCFRITQNGGRMIVTPTMRFAQVTRSSLRELWRQYYQWGVFRTETIRKHRRPAAARQLAPPALAMGLSVAVTAQLAGVTRRPIGTALLAAYASALGVVAARAANDRRRLDLMAHLPAAMATMHIAYGVGFVEGLLNRRGEGGRRERRGTQ